ncbi:hypothetical protein FGW84_00225, partial [Xylella fastidiosa subsp. multiplex]|nr:hypothetical protein [Xylella fastidiosa subsp. multiplex]
QTVGRIDVDGALGQRHRGDDGTDERHQQFGAVGPLDRQQFAGRGVQHLGHQLEGLAVRTVAGEALGTVTEVLDTAAG